MKYKSLLKGVIALLLVWAVLGSTALAMRTIRDPLVKKGGSPVAGARVEVIEATARSTGSAPYYTGTLRASGQTGADGVWSTSTAIQDGSSFIMKGWSDNNPGLNKYYGFSGPYSVGTTKDTFDANNVLIDLTYKAAPPYKPVINKIDEISSTAFPANTKSASLTISSLQPAGGDGEREVSSCEWSYGTESGKLSVAAGKTGTSLTLNASELTAGATYYFRVKYKGIFGDSEPSDEIAYPLGSGGAVGGAPDSIEIVLRKKSGDLGINTIAFPFLPATDEKGNRIATADSLVKALNGLGAGYVATFGYWDETTQKEAFYAFDDKGNVVQKVNISEEPAALALARGKGYQISVTGDKTLKLSK